MKYYPKSQIKTSLYTKGNEFIVSQTGDQYKGYYWGTSTGEFYSGKTPDDRPSNRLSPISSVDKNTLKVQQNVTQSIDEQNSYYIPDPSYNSAKNIPLNKQAPLSPKQSIPVPSAEDYANGYIMRYFLKRNNGNQFIEISKADYLLYTIQSPTVQYELYAPSSLKWYIKGNSVDFNNQSAVIQIENSMGWYGFSQYFKGKFNQFYK